LGGCAQPVQVPVAPHAPDPVCAAVVLALPDEVEAGQRRTTSSQATAAWVPDDGGEPVVLRCGVEPPGPTTERCVAVELVDGTSIDWVSVADDATGQWVFTTYGRVPAVGVTIPVGRSSAILVEIAPAVSQAPAGRTCL